MILLSNGTLKDPDSSLSGYAYFFEKYGTHVIVSAYIGRSLDLEYYMCTNETMINNTIEADFSGGITASIGNIADVKADISTSCLSDYGCTTSKTKCHWDVKQSGGYIFPTIDGSELNEAYKEWLRDTNHYQNIVSYDKNGLMPLWKLIPDFINIDLNVFKAEYAKYAMSNSTFIEEDKGCKQIPAELTYMYDFLENPYNKITITDSGRFNQPFFELNLRYLSSDQFPYQLLNATYSKMRITIYLAMNDIYDGYHYVFVYSKYENNDRYKIFNSEPMDIKESGYYTKNNFNSLEQTISLSTNPLVENKLYLLFGASGAGRDDWQATKVSVKVELF